MPDGLTADTIDGSAFLSLVSFGFNDTKVKGIKVPYHVNFPEINLRFYVKEAGSGRRGVVFIRELVPRFMVSLFANLLYNENYRTHSMSSSLDSVGGKIRCAYTVDENRKKYSISVNAEDKPFLPAADSIEHFFKEHEWGFGKSKSGGKLVYRVVHPYWEIYPVIDFGLNFDFAAIYGIKWQFLNVQEPYSVVFAKGSEIKIFSAEK